jgi:predicted TIM-barrel fold metal-dependent hydrolase
MVRGGSAARLLAEHGVALPTVASRKPLTRPNIPIIDTHGHTGSDCQRPDFDYTLTGLKGSLTRGGGERIYVSNLEAIYGDFAAGNRRAVEDLKANPDWLDGYLVINPKMGEACLAEVRQCRANGFVGLKPYPYSFGHQLSDPIMDPVYDLAERMGLCVLCHSEHGDLRRVLEKHPKLRMLAAHMSGESLEKAQLTKEFPNVVLETSGAGSAPEDVQRAVAIAGPHKLVFGSDLHAHPIGWTLFPILASDLPETTIKAILRENALRFFG